MAKTETTVKSYFYTVTSPNGGTVTDASGKLNKKVEAGDQVTVQAPSESLTCTDDDAVIYKANFKGALAALSLLGGGETSGLPAGFRRVEYLESTGTQWLSSGVYMAEDIGVKYSAYSKDSGNNHFCGLKDPQYYIVSSIRSGNLGYLWNYWQSIYNTNEDVEGTASLNFLNDRIAIWDTDQLAGTYNIYGSLHAHTSPIGIFGLAESEDSCVNKISGKLYWLKMSKGSEIIRDFIPAIDPTGTPCLFDTVSKTPFYNAGTDDFLYPGKETQATTYSLRRPRRYAQKTEHGIRRLYHVPRGYNGTPEEYAEQNGFKILVETPQLEEGYWAPVWHEREDCIELEWVETEPPEEEFPAPEIGGTGELKQEETPLENINS